ncbi:MAG: hypothetical protein HQM08_22750 [Candidatus Riflebacteria bacterium]|nr:hypothetical protein [Candidatus Riflebacteria bacterium]
MNNRHAFNDKMTKPSGEKADNTGRYLFEAFSGKVSNVLLNTLALLPGSTDKFSVTTLIHGGKWDAAFRCMNNPNIGFSFEQTPFGMDHFDLAAFSKHTFTYQDIFTGFIFYKPYEQHRSIEGIPGLFEDGYDEILSQRLAISTNMNSEEIQTFIQEKKGILEEQYVNVKTLNGLRNSWLP